MRLATATETAISEEALSQFVGGQVRLSPHNQNDPDYWGEIKAISATERVIKITFNWLACSCNDTLKITRANPFELPVEPSYFPTACKTNFGMVLTTTQFVATFYRPGKEVLDRSSLGL